MNPLPNELDVLRDVCGRLERAGIDYMLTGSMAMNYYARPRMTRDIDIVIDLKGGNARTVAEIFADDYLISPEAVKNAIARESMFNIIHNEGVIKVDFIVRKSSEYRAVEFSRRQRVGIADFEAYLVSREDLILSKLLWARDSRSDFQLRDVRNLLGAPCDEEYLDLWASRLTVSSLLEECRP